MSTPERCPGCGASFVDMLPNDGALYECGTITSPGRMGHDSAARSHACELQEHFQEILLGAL